MSLARKISMSMLSLGLASLLVCPLAGCAQNDYTPSLGEAQLTTPTIGEAGTLRVGVNAADEPLAGVGSDKIIGINVDIAAALADNLGLKLSVIDVGTDPVSALKNDQVDIVMGVDVGQTYQGVWLSKSYLPSGIAIFSMDANAALPTTTTTTTTTPAPTDGTTTDSQPTTTTVTTTTATFAAQSSSRSAQAVIYEFGEKSLTQTQSLKDAFADLEAGTVQYVAADAIMGDYTAHLDSVDAYIIGLLSKPTGYCVAVNQANGILRDVIDEELQTLSKDGIIDIIEKKWLNGVIELQGLPQTPGTSFNAPAATTNGTESSSGTGAVGDNASPGATNNNTTTTPTNPGAGAVS